MADPTPKDRARAIAELLPLGSTQMRTSVARRIAAAIGEAEAAADERGYERGRVDERESCDAALRDLSRELADLVSSDTLSGINQARQVIRSRNAKDKSDG